MPDFRGAVPSASPFAARARVGVLWLGLFGLGSAGCVPLGLGRFEDSSAPREYQSALRSHEQCAPEVEVVRSVGEANRPYREVANLSANCYPGVLSECERRLVERACELKAHAIILTATKGGGTPLGGTTDSRVTRSALAVRWVEPSTTAVSSASALP
jgi:hypothetical protein